MKKSLRKPNKTAPGAVQLNELRGVNHGAIVVKNAQTVQTIAKKVEGKEMLSKVKKYEPVVIKGYKYAF